MTVAELIHKLETFPPEAEVVVAHVFDSSGIVDWGNLDWVSPRVLSGHGDRIYLS